MKLSLKKKGIRYRVFRGKSIDLLQEDLREIPSKTRRNNNNNNNSKQKGEEDVGGPLLQKAEANPIEGLP